MDPSSFRKVLEPHKTPKASPSTALELTADKPPKFKDSAPAKSVTSFLTAVKFAFTDQENSLVVNIL